MEIRKITKDDMVKVVKLHQYAYGFWTDQEVRDEDHDFMIPENLIGLFEKDELVTVLTIMKVHQSIRGVLKGMGGISMVCSYPEARMKGYVRAILQSAFLEMKEEGYSVSMLEPFRETFYIPFGYVPAYSRYRMKAPLDGLHFPSDATIGDDWEFERCQPVDAKDKYLTFIQEFGPITYHGFAFNSKMPDVEWKRRNKNRLFVFVKRHGKVEALARYQIKGFMHFEEEGQLIIDEMYWRNFPAQNALFNFLGKHRDQIKTLNMRIPYGTNFQHWFIDLKEWVEIKTWNPWMVRIIDVKVALQGLPAPAAGELIMKVNDSQCGWNNGTYLLQSDGKQLAISVSKRVPNLETTINGLSALIYGTHSIEALEYDSWIKSIDQRIRPLLRTWFPELPLYNPYNF